MRRALGEQRGQAAVELVALLPVVALVAAVLWQAVVAGQAVWLAGSAARAAARAEAVGGDSRAAARAVLPGSLEHGLKVARRSEGGVGIEIRVPLVVGEGTLTTVSASAHLDSQKP